MRRAFRESVRRPVMGGVGSGAPFGLALKKDERGGEEKHQKGYQNGSAQIAALKPEMIKGDGQGSDSKMLRHADIIEALHEGRGGSPR